MTLTPHFWEINEVVKDSLISSLNNPRQNSVEYLPTFYKAVKTSS